MVIRSHHKFTEMNAFLGICVSACTLFVAGAWNTHRLAALPEIPGYSVSDTTPCVSAEPKPPNMWADDATFYNGETIELHFTPPNAPYLGIIDPNGSFFYLVFPGESVAGELTPLVESARFIDLNNLKINTALLKADPYTYGVRSNQPVFTKSGTYTFILGENLHVDDPDLLDQVVVRYIHATRPTNTSIDIAINQRPE